MIYNNDEAAERRADEEFDSGNAAGANADIISKSRKRRIRRRRKTKRDTANIQIQPVTDNNSYVELFMVAPDVEAGIVAEPPVESRDEADAQTTSRSRRRRRGPRKGRKSELDYGVSESPADKTTEPQNKPVRILINARYTDEKRVAIVEGDILTDFYMEVSSRESLKGNIYKGVITSVTPGLQAVFVDFGHKRHGFLQFKDVMPELYQPAKDGSRGKRSVQNSLVKGQELLVQVTKDGHGAKGASLTTYISIPGRYIVMMPGQKKIGISRKIESRKDRDRLKDIFTSLKLPENMGFILRTACSDSLEEELSRDLKYLTKLWERIKSDAAKVKAPALIYKEQDIAMRTVRDYLTSDVTEILIDDPKTCASTKAFLKKIMPWRKVNVTHYKDKAPLFSLYNIEGQISKLSQRTVMLPSKGYLVFDKTEALTAIDVNSGRSRREDNIESTALTTNLEAAREIARQIRLRDIGGLIVIDFIDMESAKNRKLVEEAMANAVSSDKASIEMTGLSRFCILEMTRERFRTAYSDIIAGKCPLCDGRGVIESDEFTAMSAMRELHMMAASGGDNISSITCRMPIISANILLNAKRSELASLEKDYGVSISVIADPTVPIGKYVLEAVKK